MPSKRKPHDKNLVAPCTGNPKPEHWNTMYLEHTTWTLLRQQQWLDLKIGHQDGSLSYGRQGIMPYRCESLGRLQGILWSACKGEFTFPFCGLNHFCGKWKLKFILDIILGLGSANERRRYNVTWNIFHWLSPYPYLCHLSPPNTLRCLKKLISFLVQDKPLFNLAIEIHCTTWHGYWCPSYLVQDKDPFIFQFTYTTFNDMIAHIPWIFLPQHQ